MSWRVGSQILGWKHLDSDGAHLENLAAVGLQQCLSLVPLDDDVLHDEELDKELLWNLQLLSEVFPKTFFPCWCVTASCLMPLKGEKK